MLHFGTFAAVLVVFRADVAAMLTDSVAAVGETIRGGWLDGWRRRAGARTAWLVLVATLPTGIIGLLMERSWQGLAASTGLVCAMLLVTAALLWMTKGRSGGDRNVTGWTALLLGVVQGVALLPGISRSGSTIAVALLLGLGRTEAGRFSFLMSLPAVAGAGLLELRHVSGLSGQDLAAALLGTGGAFVVGWLALVGLLRWVERGKLHLFSWYLLAVGGFGLVWSLLH